MGLSLFWGGMVSGAMSEVTFKDSQVSDIKQADFFLEYIYVSQSDLVNKENFRNKLKHMLRWRNLRNHSLKRFREVYMTGNRLQKEQIALYDSGKRVTHLSLLDYKLSLDTIGRGSRNRIACPIQDSERSLFIQSDGEIRGTKPENNHSKKKAIGNRKE